jgi:alkylation response protein AidB-like acyl-CoA dehydrogenase
MNFAELRLDPNEQAFRDSVEAFVREFVTEAVHERERRTGSGFDEGLHLALGARGWVVPDWPVERGGAGLDRLRVHVLENELVANRAPGILRATTRLTLPTIARFGDPELASGVLREAAAGTVRVCLGYTEPDAGSDLAGVRTRAVRDGDMWQIDGQKMFTTGAQHSQYCFMLTRTDSDLPRHKGLTVFLVPLDLPGIEIAPVETLGGERTNFVYLDGVSLPDRFRIGDVNAGWKVVNGALDAEHGIGQEQTPFNGGRALGFERYLAIALQGAESWAKTTTEDGRAPIQSATVRERLAAAAYGVELAAATPAPLNRTVSADRLVRHAADLVMLPGLEGLLTHGSEGAVADGDLEYFHRFAQGTAIYGGTTEVFRNIVAERFLGLPRSTPKR